MSRICIFIICSLSFGCALDNKVIDDQKLSKPSSPTSPSKPDPLEPVLNPPSFFVDEQGIVREKSGDIKVASFYEAAGLDPNTGEKVASDLCEALGLHFPSALELAEEAKERGARGPLPSLDGEKIAWIPIKTADSEGRSTEFYYSPLGYQAPEGPRWVWASSRYATFPQYAYLFGYGFYGWLTPYHHLSESHPVRCVSKRR